MKVSDYIVEYLIEKKVTDVFGYPGGMVTHLIDSFSKYEDKISAHTMYHEQAAAFAACGYAQSTNRIGVAYATSGPGATNLITGIGNAYFDSIPVIFITGQVNTFEMKDEMPIRQRGFQETDIVSMVKPITKYAKCVKDVSEVAKSLQEAFFYATEGRKGPVLLDIPMNIFRSEIDIPDNYVVHCINAEKEIELDTDIISNIQVLVECSRRPCFVLGNGVNLSGIRKEVLEIIESRNVPVVTSMIAVDLLSDLSKGYGYIGAYGDRTANFIVAKSDLLIAIGTRLDVRQVGGKREKFAPNAQIIRFDVDDKEIQYAIRTDDINVCLDMHNILKVVDKFVFKNIDSEWIKVCNSIKASLVGIDDRYPNKFIKDLSNNLPDNLVVTTDVGQNQVWIAQSYRIKSGQRIYFSGGHGSMGYSLPAAIGVCHAMNKQPVICFTGDGGLQMNIQELQYVYREQLPIKIIVFNNDALGMIRHFQEMYFDSNYYHTKPEGGYSAPKFERVASAYGINAEKVNIKDYSFNMEWLTNDKPYLLEVIIDDDTYVYPKLEFGKPNQDQEPLLNRKLYNEIMEL